MAKSNTIDNLMIVNSKQRKFSPSGTCFSFSWEQIADIVQDWRVKHRYATENESVKMIYVADDEAVFYTKMSGSGSGNSK